MNDINDEEIDKYKQKLLDNPFEEDENEIEPVVKYAIVDILDYEYGADDLAYASNEFDKTVAANPEHGYHLMEYTYVGLDRIGRVLRCTEGLPGIAHK